MIPQIHQVQRATVRVRERPILEHVHYYVLRVAPIITNNVVYNRRFRFMLGRALVGIPPRSLDYLLYAHRCTLKRDLIYLDRWLLRVTFDKLKDLQLLLLDRDLLLLPRLVKCLRLKERTVTADGVGNAPTS